MENTMSKILKTDYSRLDRPEILMFLFHPRPEGTGSQMWEHAETLMIPVGPEMKVGGRFYPSSRSSPTILFFHGNGEIVADYDDIGKMYAGMGINFMPVDYRGYGLSTGRPTIAGMMKDCHAIFPFVLAWLSERHYHGPMILMGRSLGSASALEIAYHHTDRVKGLIIESGFARVEPLLRLFGMTMAHLGIREEDGFQNLEKVLTFTKPTLVIHGERDHLIPCDEGRDLFHACLSKEKELLIIQGANHNDILSQGLKEYMEAVRALVRKTR